MEIEFEINFKYLKTQNKIYCDKTQTSCVSIIKKIKTQDILKEERVMVN